MIGFHQQQAYLREWYTIDQPPQLVPEPYLKPTPYEAAIATADLIEQNPDLYDFCLSGVPCKGVAGCLLGHMGRLAGFSWGVPVPEVAHRFLRMTDNDFYCKMDEIGGPRVEWRHSARAAARILRKLAKKEWTYATTMLL